ncbi:phosphonopyruvate decarboxylase [Alphaproteobacteria bacterium]|nr:phosphonopyruvate decarboxylase [Alphaproteobacteria bacterium]
MIKCEDYLELLIKNNINFFTGVPDSLLKEFCSCLDKHLGPLNHVISSNEGAAVGLAIGNYIGTNEIPLVYMQNSGLGNAINPILSLASSEVYGIPMVLMIGWRGEPLKKDEPQHFHQGRITIPLLETMDIPVVILDSNIEKAKKQTQFILMEARRINGPVAIVIKKNTFENFEPLHLPPSVFSVSRESAIITILKLLEKDVSIVCTTGMASRELFEFRAKNNQKIEKDFLTVGGMGHASQIALGIARARPNKLIYCLDGDGAVLMHMGSLGILGQSNQKNFVHIVLNNGSHDSVGGQPTICNSINLSNIAKSCGYKNVFTAHTESEIKKSILQIKTLEGPTFLEIKIKPGNRKNIGRPSSTPQQNKQALMNYLGVSDK